MQLDRLSLMEWDTQPVNGLDSLENYLAALVKTVQLTHDWFSLNVNSLAPAC